MTNQYDPDYPVSPHEVIQDYLEGLNMGRFEFVMKSGLTGYVAQRLINGYARITPEIAEKLEYCLGRPAHFWLALQERFDEGEKSE